MSSRTCEEIYNMYDEASERYKEALRQTYILDKGMAHIARFEAREWAKRMRWLDTKLKELGVE